MSAHESYADTTEVAGPSNRKFGLTLGALLLALAAWRWHLGSHVALYGTLAAVGAILALLGAAAPFLLALPNHAWLKLGFLLAAIMTPLAMMVIFCAVFVPVALVMRLRGRDQLCLRRKPADASYWVERDPPGPQPDSMVYQF